MTSTAGRRQFHLLICGLLILYLVVEVAYVRRLPLVMDEFQGASTVAQFEHGLPYRDFLPYKTVLGYYIQLPGLHAGSGPWQKLIAVKLEMALVNVLALGAAAAVLSRMFAPRAVGAALVLTIVMSTFLERSSDLRVDMLTSWAGLASLLLILNRRYFFAGAIAGLSFLISQKGLYYGVAGGAALGANWILAHRTREQTMAIVRFVTAAVLALASYLAFWAMWSSWSVVLGTTFWSPRRIVLSDLYDIRLAYWTQTILRNPAFYGFGILALVKLARLPKASADHDRTQALLAYALALLALALWFKQPWPYFFVLIIPTFLVLHAALFDANLHQRGGSGPLEMKPWAFALYLVLGVAYPLARLPANLARDSGFQRQMVELTDFILEPRDVYLAGADMVYGRNQAVGSLRWIDRPRAAAIQRMSPAQLDAIVDTLERASLKVVIDNYRLQALPERIRAYLRTQMTPLWGNLLIYAPIVGGGDHDMWLKFSGRYSVEDPVGKSVILDGRRVASGEELTLEKGVHRTVSKTAFRLTFLPIGWESKALPKYREHRDLFPDVYSY